MPRPILNQTVGNRRCRTLASVGFRAVFVRVDAPAKAGLCFVASMTEAVGHSVLPIILHRRGITPTWVAGFFDLDLTALLPRRRPAYPYSPLSACGSVPHRLMVAVVTEYLPSLSSKSRTPAVEFFNLNVGNFNLLSPGIVCPKVSLACHI